MTNPVLCAVDISNGDQDVETIGIAAQQAKLSGSQLDVITVVPDYGMSVVAGYFNQDHHDKIVADARQLLSDLVIKVLGPDENAKVRHIVATGRAYEEVLKLAKSTKASLIVVGTHTANMADYLLGPNAARIVRHADCSVYVVR
jgi:universal stress protein F